MIGIKSFKLNNLREKLQDKLTERYYHIITDDKTNLEIAVNLTEGKIETQIGIVEDVNNEYYGLEIHQTDVEFRSWHTKSNHVEIITFRWLEKWYEETGNIDIYELEVL